MVTPQSFGPSFAQTLLLPGLFLYAKLGLVSSTIFLFCPIGKKKEKIPFKLKHSQLEKSNLKGELSQLG